MDTKQPTTFTRTKNFVIRKGSELYRQLDNLCFLAKNMHNTTLFILRQLHFATFPRNGNNPEYYLNQIKEKYPEFYPFITKEEVEINSKEDGKKIVTFYRIAVSCKKNAEHKITGEKAFSTIFQKSENENYRAIYARSAMNAVKQAVKEFKSYERAISDYSKNPHKYDGEPHIPRFLNKESGRAPYSIDKFKLSGNGEFVINGKIRLKNVYFDEKDADIKMVVVVPHLTEDTYVVSIVYKTTKYIVPNGTHYFAIDLGIDNFMAVTSDIGDAFLVSGKKIKSVNHWYNVEMARLQSEYARSSDVRHLGKKMKACIRKRNNKIKTLIEQCVSVVIDNAEIQNVKTIFVGHNKGWKQHSNLGRRTNQKFVQIPFNLAISKLKHKGEMKGIEVIEIGESYTSKCSAIDNEEICEHVNYIGKRGGKHNKEFITGKGKLINADVNGSLNILRFGMGKDIETIGKSIFAPPKFKKVGLEKFKMQPQSLLNNSEDMVAEATVDSRCSGTHSRVIAA